MLFAGVDVAAEDDVPKSVWRERSKPKIKSAFTGGEVRARVSRMCDLRIVLLGTTRHELHKSL